MKPSTTVISLLTSVLFLLGASSANAMQVDSSGLDTPKVDTAGRLGDLHWPEVHLKSSVGYNNQLTREIVAGEDVRIDTQVSMFLDQPGLAALTRLVRRDDGTEALEHVELKIDDDKPQLHVTSRWSVRVDLIARIDTGFERAKSVPIYAYRQDAKHVMLVVRGAGLTVGRATDDQLCSTLEGGSSLGDASCAFTSVHWTDGAVELRLGPEQRVGQVRGDIVFDKAPKGETNDAYSFIVNASFANVGRDRAPVLSLTTRVRPTPPPMPGDEGGE